MNLRHRLYRERSGKKRRQPFQPSLFSRIGAIVRHYHLGEAFLHSLAEANPAPPSISPGAGKLLKKPPPPGGLFFLATPEEFEIIMAIMQQCDNPYLAYAHCPEEILLSATLYRRRPHLSPEMLQSRHFAALLQEDDASP